MNYEVRKHDNQVRDRTRFGIGVDPALALKMLLLFAPELVVVGILLAGVLVLVLVLEVFFFEAGDPNKVVLGDLGVSFLRLPVGVLVPLDDDDGDDDVGSSGFVAVVELLFPSRRTRRAGGGVAVVVDVAAVAEVPVEFVLLPSFGTRWERVLRLVPVVVFRLSLPFLLAGCALLSEEEEADSSLDS